LIQVSGHVPPNCGRFVVNLQNGQQNEPNEIPLHVSVRFNDPNDRRPVVVRTNRSYGNWGNEEREGGNPFHPGAHFDMLILVEPNEFKIAVNGQHFTSFRHRNPLAEANHVGISGDVQIHSVRTF
jgi:galectin-9